MIIRSNVLNPASFLFRLPFIRIASRLVSRVTVLRKESLHSHTCQLI